MKEEDQKVLAQLDLVRLYQEVFAARKFVIKITVIFTVLGLIVALLSKKEYEATCKLFPESSDVDQLNLGGLGSLAGLAGINVANQLGQGLSPDLYPEIVSSEEFILDLMESEIYFQYENRKLGIQEYFQEYHSPSTFEWIIKYTIGLPSLIKGSSIDTIIYNPKNLLIFTREQYSLLSKLRNRIQVTVENNSGIIMVTSEMPDPYAAAELTNLVVSQLTDAITKYKTEKASVNLHFIEERFKESQQAFGLAQKELAIFSDQNRNFNTNQAQIEFKRLQNEYDIAFEVYKGLASQLEQARIKVKEDTPVFTVIDSVKVPNEKSKPKRIQIVTLMFILGFIFSIGWVLAKDALTQKNPG